MDNDIEDGIDISSDEKIKEKGWVPCDGESNDMIHDNQKNEKKEGLPFCIF